MDQNFNFASENQENASFNESLRMLDLSQQTIFRDRAKDVAEAEALELLSCSQDITKNFRMIIG